MLFFDRSFLFGMVVLFALAACGGGGDEDEDGDTSAPTASVDQSGTTLGKTAAITITFSESMDITTLVLNGALAGESDGGAWSTSVETNDTLTLTPSTNWTSGPGRDLTLDVSDLAGNPLATLTRSYLVKLAFANFQDAAVVIGQADFLGGDQNQGGAVGANTLGSLYGNPLVEGGSLYLGDYGNERVLGFNSLPTTNNANADFVLGQPDFTTNNASTARDRMSGPQSIVSTVDGKLVVLEYGNRRVLIYNTIPSSGAALPDVVVGQPDFDTSDFDCTADSLGSPETATVTPNGKLVVTDSENHRVLIWNALPTANGQPADLVLGQADMTHCALNDDDQDGTADTIPSARTLSYPAGVWADDSRLTINDRDNNRVLIWTSFPTQSFQPADLVLGQANFTNNTGNDDDQDGTEDTTPSARTLRRPYDGIHSNGEQLVVTDSDNNRVLMWNSFPSMNFQPADLVLGQTNFTNSAVNDDDQDGTEDTTPSARTLAAPRGALFHEDKLLIMDGRNGRLLIYQSQ